jgi:hypothetical protein
MDIKPVEFWSKEIEEKTGEEIMMNTPACIIYKTSNNNCKGCAYELNCAKLSNIIMLQYHLASYKPIDFLDTIKASQQAVAMTTAIMNAKSVDEIEKIIRGEKE